MPKKSKSKKSKGKEKRKAKALLRKSEAGELESLEAKPGAPEQEAFPSWSTDDVYKLLKAVNEVTLQRMEKQILTVQGKVNSIEPLIRDIDNRLKTVQLTDLVNLSSNVLGIARTQSEAVYPALLAIKTKTDRLP